VLTPTPYSRRLCQQCLQALCAAGADASTAHLPLTARKDSSRGHYSLTSKSLTEAVLLAELTTKHNGSTEEQRRSAAAATARITASLRALQQGGLDVHADACYLHVCAAFRFTEAVTALLDCGADVHKGACL
jgi:hypothetical protein